MKQNYDKERDRNFKNNNNYKNDGKGGNYKKKGLLDSDFNLENSYFYKDISSTQWTLVEKFINEYFTSGKSDVDSIKKFFAAYPIKHGEEHINRFRKM